MPYHVKTAGSIDIRRDSASGDIAVFWPGWVFENNENPGPTGLAVDDSTLAFGGRRIMLGMGAGAHVTLHNGDGKADDRLRSIRVGVDPDGAGGYTVAELESIAADAKG